MQIIIACAKLMTTDVQPDRLPHHTPMFQPQAESVARQLAAYPPDAFMDMLRVNRPIAVETMLRYHNFFEPSTLRPAGLAYDGMVFRRLGLASMSLPEIEYADSHLNICSFLYGLLRPLDLINPYRLEGDVVLPDSGVSMFDYWKPLLTDELIRRVTSDDGILINLASDEMRQLFDWRRVSRELQVITPTFKVVKANRPRTIVIYAKMCRGAMARYIIRNRLTRPDELRQFEYEGFRIDPADPSGFNFLLTD